MKEMTPCDGRWFVFDVLIDKSDGPVYAHARDEARVICAGCPIRVQCHTDNADEKWAAAIRERVNWREPVARPTCGSTAGVSAHRYNKERCCSPCLVTAAARERAKKKKKRTAA